jgi:hypothetical protein
MISVIEGRRHSCSIVESNEFNPYAGRLGYFVGDFGHVQESGTIGDAEFYRGKSLISASFGEVCRFQEAKGVVLADYQIKIYLGLKLARQSHKKREDV